MRASLYAYWPRARVFMDTKIRKKLGNPGPQEGKEIGSEASGIELGTLKANKLSGMFKDQQEVNVAGRGGAKRRVIGMRWKR